jgi:hypothetical protein
MTDNLLFTGGEFESLPISATDVQPFFRRESLRHLLIGSPEGVEQTIHHLHNLGYVEAGLWTCHLPLLHPQLIVRPDEGEVVNYLVRYRAR